eukprot:NODE_132_length_16614_cov_0.935392.p15 type:complete len:111 gc:universal NODE_132_length_16614_cov_0.935392:4780-5112(+)
MDLVSPSKSPKFEFSGSILVVSISFIPLRGDDHHCCLFNFSKITSTIVASDFFSSVQVQPSGTTFSLYSPSNKTSPFAMTFILEIPRSTLIDFLDKFASNVNVIATSESD